MQKHPNTERTVVNLLDREFASFGESLRILTKSVPVDLLYRQPPSHTIGENILRSAGAVEQTFGGITANLWDDPFEWTLPEKLSTKKAIMGYLGEVVEARNNGLAFITSDGDLSRRLPAPETLKPILQVLVEAVARAENYLGQAEAVAKMLT